MKEVMLVFIILCYMVPLMGCTINPGKNASFGSAVQNVSGANTTQNTDKSIDTENCMLDDKGNLLVMGEDGYEPYTYNKFPKIPGKLAQIIQMLRKGDNNIELNYYDKLYLYYGLEENKCQIIGGNSVDIFNFSIDMEQDIISFSVENLTFSSVLDDDYSPQLLETFNLLFGVNGDDIYRYFMTFYKHPTDGVTDETLINGMRVAYRCTPKHKLVISLVADK